MNKIYLFFSVFLMFFCSGLYSQLADHEVRIDIEKDKSISEPVQRLRASYGGHECPVCQDNVVEKKKGGVFIPYCGHSFHYTCLTPNNTPLKKCPICRASLLQYDEQSEVSESGRTSCEEYIKCGKKSCFCFAFGLSFWYLIHTYLQLSLIP